MQFYTYLYFREDGSPFYVGKGSGNRAFKSSKNHRPPLKEKITLQYWQDEATALAYERYLIDFWGRQDTGAGCLSKNFSDGGDNPPSWKGKKFSEEHKRKLSIKLIGNTYGSGCKGKKHSAERVEKNKTSHCGWNHTEEVKLKMSFDRKGIPKSEATKEKHKTRMKGKPFPGGSTDFPFGWNLDKPNG